MFGIPFSKRETAYHRLEKGDYIYDEARDSSAKDSSLRPCDHHTVSMWMLSTLFFSMSTIYFAILSWSHPPVHSFETGFSTDLRPSTSQISLRQVQFTGSPSFSASGEEYVPDIPGAVRYVGEPSPEIDEAWRVLSADRYFLLTEDEAREAWGPSYTEFWNEQWGGYLTAFDMFHTLHCLDHIRQAFYPDYYPQTTLHGKLHNDHCIDHLRQMIMCNGDVTPIPTRYYPGIGQNYIDSDRTHTCRNFDQLRAWTSSRHNGSLAVPPQFRGSS